MKKYSKKQNKKNIVSKKKKTKIQRGGVFDDDKIEENIIKMEKIIEDTPSENDDYKAYFKILLLKYHPDKTTHKNENEENMKLINDFNSWIKTHYVKEELDSLTWKKAIEKVKNKNKKLDIKLEKKSNINTALKKLIDEFWTEYKGDSVIDFSFINDNSNSNSNSNYSITKKRMKIYNKYLKLIINFIHKKFTLINKGEDTNLFLMREFCNEISWAIPTINVLKYIKEIVKNNVIIEIGAGNGLWAALLTIISCEILATDNYSWIDEGKEDEEDEEDDETYYDIPYVKNEEEALSNYIYYKPNKSKILFLCWPPNNNPMSFNALKYFTEEMNGKKFIYIGDMKGGLTGTDEFFDYLYKYYDEKIKTEKEIDELVMPNWYGNNSSIILYIRNKTQNEKKKKN